MQLNRTAATAVIEGRITDAVVASNQRLSRLDNGDLVGYLRSYPIVKRHGCKLTLNHHNLQGPAMRSAMCNFMDLLGVNGRISFAKGAFIVTVNGRVHARQGSVMEIEL